MSLKTIHEKFKQLILWRAFSPHAHILEAFCPGGILSGDILSGGIMS